MGACASRGRDTSGSFTSQKDLRFAYEGRVVTTSVTKGSSIEKLNSFLLSAFGIDESLYAVTGVLVTVAGPLIPFFMSPYLPSNGDAPPYAIVVAPLKSLAISNWGRAPEAEELANATIEWSKLESGSVAGASRLLGLLRRYGYVRLRLPDAGAETFQSAAASAREFFSQPEEWKRQHFLGFNQHKFVGFSHARGSARQWLQLRTTRGKVTRTGKHVPVFDAELTEAYLALQSIAYRLFELLCHPDLAHLTHLSPDLVSSLLDPPCESQAAFNECGSSVPEDQFVGSNVFRVYQYLRGANSPSPGLAGAATTVHTDMGLLTVSPQANLPGLTILNHADASTWANVEMTTDSENYVFVFAGETMAQLTQGYLRAALHFVDERTPSVARFSMPFFLRARQKAVLPAVEGFCSEMTVEHFMREVLHQWKQVWGHKPTTDF